VIHTYKDCSISSYTRDETSFSDFIKQTCYLSCYSILVYLNNQQTHLNLTWLINIKIRTKHNFLSKTHFHYTEMNCTEENWKRDWGWGSCLQERTTLLLVQDFFQKSSISKKE